MSKLAELKNAHEVFEQEPSAQIFVTWPRGSEYPIIWHCCRTGWVGMVPSLHKIPSRDPLTLDPSVDWTCCGRHGHITNGEWV